jgi:folate-binding protein YgfZ
LLPELEAAGGVTGVYQGRHVVRHFGDPEGEYAAATGGVAIFDRSHRTRLTVSGRAPRQMLNGVLTGVLPTAPESSEPGVRSGTATYHAVLTPKGKMITDLLALLPGDEEEDGFLLDVPVAGRGPLLAHFGRFLPPRFAKVTDASEAWAAVSVVGPDAPDALSRVALGLRVEPAALLASAEGAWWSVGADGCAVARTSDVWPPAWNVYGPAEAIRALWRALVRDGAVPAGLGVWKTLGIEAGRPSFGTDMDDGTLPPEAGIVDRAIDQTKGCYTGQEVIVRIRDRGHVNRHLRRLDLGDLPSPAPGTELFTDEGKAVGSITSAVESPRAGGVLAFAYVRRGVRSVRVASPDGPGVAVPEGSPEPL